MHGGYPINIYYLNVWYGAQKCLQKTYHKKWKRHVVSHRTVLDFIFYLKVCLKAISNHRCYDTSVFTVTYFYQISVDLSNVIILNGLLRYCNRIENIFIVFINQINDL